MQTILFIHAGTDDREMYADYLRLQGYQVIEASSTDDGLQHLASAHLLVTSLMVPGTFTCVDMIARVRREYQQLPVIVVTASVIREEHAAAARAGAAVILLKPSYPSDLVGAIQSLLPQHSASHGSEPTGR